MAGLEGPCARGLGPVGTGSRAHGTHTEGTVSPGTRGFGGFLGDLGSKWMDLVAGVEVGVGGGMEDEGRSKEHTGRAVHTGSGWPVCMGSRWPVCTGSSRSGRTAPDPWQISNLRSKSKGGR